MSRGPDRKLREPAHGGAGPDGPGQAFALGAYVPSLEGADHPLTGRNQARREARIIGAWADPYLTDG